MIYIPKHRDIEVVQNFSIEMRGFYRVQIRKADTMEVRFDTGFFPNVLLTSGFNAMGEEADWLTHCQVGTDNTLPAAGQTGLLGHHTTTSDRLAAQTVTGAEGTEPYFGWKRHVYRFAIGTVAANLTEVGVGWGTGPTDLISRALIIDPDTKLPTTITPLIGELLDVTYEMRYYPPLVDVAGPVVTLDGTAYNTLTRASEVTSITRWAGWIGTIIGVSPTYPRWTAYDGELGTILLSPSGNNDSADLDATNAAYLPNQYNRDVLQSCGPATWNLGADVRSIQVPTSAGTYQVRFGSVVGDNPIPKTVDYVLNLVSNIAWSAL